MKKMILAAVLLTATSLWAADGWYLLIPPRGDYDERADFLSAYKILDDKPVSQWGQEGAFDSALDCETARNDLMLAEQLGDQSSLRAYVKAVGERTDPVALRMQRFRTEARNANVLAFMASRCIRSNDPRLRQ